MAGSLFDWRMFPIRLEPLVSAPDDRAGLSLQPSSRLPALRSCLRTRTFSAIQHVRVPRIECGSTGLCIADPNSKNPDYEPDRFRRLCSAVVSIYQHEVRRHLNAPIQSFNHNFYCASTLESAVQSATLTALNTVSAQLEDQCRFGAFMTSLGRANLIEKSAWSPPQWSDFNVWRQCRQYIFSGLIDPPSLIGSLSFTVKFSDWCDDGGNCCKDAHQKELDDFYMQCASDSCTYLTRGLDSVSSQLVVIIGVVGGAHAIIKGGISLLLGLWITRSRRALQTSELLVPLSSAASGDV
jgi:hypothetical protein